MEKRNLVRFKAVLKKAKKVAIDSSLFIYQFSHHKEYSDVTNTLFKLAENGEIKLVTSTISVVELFVKPEEAKNQEILQEYDKVLIHFPNLQIIPVDYSVARLTAKLRGMYRRIKTPDLIQIAVALITECDLFLT